MSQHQSFQGITARLIRQHGKPVELVEIINAGPAYAPTQSEHSETIYALQTRFKQIEKDGQLIKAMDVQFLLDSDVPPSLNGRIRDGDKDYAIVNFDEIQPGEQTVLYKVQCRL